MVAYSIRSAAGGVRPEFEHERVRVRRAAATPEDAASRRSRNINERPLRRFVLSWKRASDGQRLALTRAWDASRGCSQRMTFVPLGESTTINVLFVPGTLKLRRLSPIGTHGLHEMSVEIEEVR